MNLTIDEWNILLTQHGSAREARAIRKRLVAAGYHFCSHCKAVKPSAEFPECPRHLGGRRPQCYVCGRKRGKARRAGFDPIGIGPAVARWQRENPAACKYHTDRTIARRRALGMTEAQARYKEAPPAALQAAWDAIKGLGGPGNRRDK